MYNITYIKIITKEFSLNIINIKLIIVNDNEEREIREGNRSKKNDKAIKVR
jgi:hypothetical protein